MIKLDQVSVQSSAHALLLNQVSASISSGGFHVICGPNGSGKTTLLRSLCGLQELTAGSISYKNKSLNEFTKRDIAKLLSWVPAEQPLHFAYSVSDVVSWGRWHVHQGIPSKIDQKIIAEAMDAMNIQSFADRNVNELSLGEQKRVHLARAIAADTPYLLLDEPSGPLDAGITLDIMEWIRNTTRTQNKTVIASLHDLSLIANFADTVTLLAAGRVLGHGSIDDIFTAAHIESAFGVRLHQTKTDDGTLILLTRSN